MIYNRRGKSAPHIFFISVVVTVSFTHPSTGLIGLEFDGGLAPSFDYAIYPICRKSLCPYNNSPYDINAQLAINRLSLVRVPVWCVMYKHAVIPKKDKTAVQFLGSDLSLDIITIPYYCYLSLYL